MSRSYNSHALAKYQHRNLPKKYKLNKMLLKIKKLLRPWRRHSAWRHTNGRQI